ncbi:MAG: helix-turn-helix transcriptional regulator [Anaerolineae bacterium]
MPYPGKALAGGPSTASSGLRSSQSGVDIVGFWRLFEIHRLISQGTYPNCAYLSQRLEVHRRTVERDIERLRDLFCAPIEYDPKRRGYYYTETFSLPMMRLREGEAIALFLGQKLLMQCRGTPFEEPVRQAMAKIRMLLPHEVEVNLERTVDAVSFHVEPLRGEEVEVAARYQTLVTAVEQRRTIEMDYFTASRGVATRRRVDPYHLRFADGAWYCIGYCYERKDVRIFALDRMVHLSLTDDRFEVPSDFSMDGYLANSWVIERGEPRKVVIEFDAEQARYVRGRRWHHSQVTEDLPDGSLRMTLTIGGLGELTRWVMSFGSHAKIVEPEDLRDAVRTEFSKALARYA